jgi:predicted extracellular nuclease
MAKYFSLIWFDSIHVDLFMHDLLIFIQKMPIFAVQLFLNGFSAMKQAKFNISLLFFLFSTSVFAVTTLTIPQIQGTGTSSTYASQIVTTAGIVTAKFIGTGKVGGYFMQDAVGDGNSLTSDGIFVAAITDNVSVGDKVQVTGTVSEVGGRTQLGTLTGTTVISSNNALPLMKVQYSADSWSWEQYEGMLLQFDQTLYVTSNYYLQQYGQLSLNPVRKFSPTNQCVPGSTEYTAMVALNAKSQLTLDDGISTTNYTPIQFADASGTRRTGERVNGLQVVVDCVNSSFYIYPAKTPVFYGNPRPAAPTDLGNYNLKVCAANLEYYLPTNYGQGYGAADATQLARQQTKIVAGLLSIDADIYGLIEIEEGQAALSTLVTAMNAATVAGRYAYINDGGTIYGTYTKVGYLYRTDKVTPYLSLKDNNTPTPMYRKKAQAFTLKSNNQRFVFSLNHYKAKSGCSSATGADADQGDGQSCYNATRIAESTSNITFLNTCKTFYGDNDVLIMGDLNAYGKEDPITTLVNAGYVDMHRAFHADTAYSYMYNGDAGYLDNVLANSTMKQQVTGVSVFHLNSDEPTMFEYSGSAYQPNMYRYSDHDPVVVGLSLGLYAGVDNLPVDNILVKPTMVDDQITVSNASGATVQLISMEGKVLKQQQIDSNECSVNLENLHLVSGVYLVRIQNRGISKRQLILKK